MDLAFITSWLSDHGLAIAFILGGALLIRRFGMIPLEGFIRRAVKTSRFQTEAQHKQREDTLLDISESIFGLIVWLVAVAFILSELNLNLEPLLAAGGLIGIVVGFGAQNIMKDLFAGIYVVTESQYQIGDVIDLDGDVGLVEDISLRVVLLRDLDGTVHHIPHGSVQRTKNLSKDYARVNLDIGVSYDTDLDKAIEVIDRVGEEMAEDADWRQQIISPPKFLRVNGFGDNSIEIKIIGETKPLEQWDITGEYRKRLKKAFDKEGITIPFPQRVIHQYQDEKASDESKD